MLCCSDGGMLTDKVIKETRLNNLKGSAMR